MRNKPLILVAAILAIVAAQTQWRTNERVEAPQQERSQPVEHPGGAASSYALEDAFQRRASNVQIEGEGIVERTLKDDNDGSRHQRFILRLASGRTLLIAHNIDLAPRVEGLREGDTVRFFGEYEWNDKGGVLHWTHHDPQGRHVAGWIEHRGRKYQ